MTLKKLTYLLNSNLSSLKIDFKLCLLYISSSFYRTYSNWHCENNSYFRTLSNFVLDGNVDNGHGYMDAMCACHLSLSMSQIVRKCMSWTRSVISLVLKKRERQSENLYCIVNKSLLNQSWEAKFSGTDRVKIKFAFPKSNILMKMTGLRPDFWSLNWKANWTGLDTFRKSACD